MSTKTCAGCTTAYAPDLGACPHCGSTEYTEDGSAVVARRFPAFVSLMCASCGRGPWQYRLPVVASGLIQIAPLYCASCGCQVQIPWPPTEDAMPKITVHGGATNARAAESSPDVDASPPLVGAEADQGHPTAVEGDTVTGDGSGEALEELPAESYGEGSEPLADGLDYDGMTLAELREEAARRELPSYGTKAQITERLREDDAS